MIRKIDVEYRYVGYVCSSFGQLHYSYGELNRFGLPYSAARGMACRVLKL